MGGFSICRVSENPVSFPRRSMKARLALLFSSLLLPASAPVAEETATAPFDPRTIVFIGSSSIDFWETLPEDFAGETVLNLGKAGTTFSHLVDQAGEWAARYPADRYVIYSGDNDIAWLRSPEKVARQFREVAETLHATNPRVRIFVLSIKPNRIPTRRIRIRAVREANARIAAEATALGYVTYVDIHTSMLDSTGQPRSDLFNIDGIHLNESGYRLWRDILLPKLAPPVTHPQDLPVPLVARPVES